MIKSLLKATSLINKIGKIQDSITIGLLGGFIGTLAIDISNALLYKTKKTEATFGHLAASFFRTPTTTSKYKPTVFLGELLHHSVGTVIGIPLFYILKKTGKDHYLAKGLVASLLTWIFLYTGGQEIGLLKKPSKVKTHYAAVWNHILYGLATVKAMVWLADPEIFSSQPFQSDQKTIQRDNLLTWSQSNQDSVSSEDLNPSY
ncbi:hypothetical protein [Desulfosporosinus sp. FKB]|uniref:hypothetical protein n=1 Tax=Desulfosporosinus sp. FKB TaxID=1969835 RepID=UPI000B49A39D|nr:hypothetical protein [Desulfosporosinus sp. FKB]